MKNYETIHRELVNRIELLRGEIGEYGEENVLLCHVWRGKSSETLRQVTLRIDNSQHRADKVVRRVVDYADCMIEEMRRLEGYWGENSRDGVFWEVMDRFIFVVDGERADFNVREVAQGDVFLDEYMYKRKRLSAEELEAKRAQWAAVLERFLHGERLEVEHLYTTEQVPGIGWIDGLPSLLADLLEGGKLADCVTLQLVEDTNDPFDPSERDAGEWQAPRYMWINGLLRGEYVCGEVPFVRDDSLIRSVGSWRQSYFEDIATDERIMLRLAPDTDPALVARAKACALKFKSELGAQLEYTLSKDDDYYEEKTPRYEPTNEQAVRLWLEHFGQIRALFTAEEAQQMLACAAPVQELFTRHGEGKYAPEEIELYRFGISVWTLLDAMNCIQAERNTREFVFTKVDDKGRAKALSRMGQPPSEELLEWPEPLRQKVSALPEELKHAPTGIDGNEISLVGMGDLSWEEGANVMAIDWHGLYIGITDIRLNGLDDVQKAEALFNELADILREAQERDHGQTRPALSNEAGTLYRSLHEAMFLDEFSTIYGETLPNGDLKKLLIHPNDGLEETKTITDRECLACMQSTGKCKSETNCFDPEEIAFEAQDIGVNARLRFRMEDGRFIHEVAVLE